MNPSGRTPLPFIRQSTPKPGDIPKTVHSHRRDGRDVPIDRIQGQKNQSDFRLVLQATVQGRVCVVDLLCF